jgi:hypothetical protein
VFRSVQSNLATDLGTSPGKVADLNEVGSRATDALHYDAAPQLAFSAPYPPKAKTREIIKLAEGRPAQKIKPAGLDADGLYIKGSCSKLGWQIAILAQLRLPQALRAQSRLY